VALNTPIAPAQLRERNTLQLPCEAAALLEFDDTQALLDALSWCADNSLPPFILGDGSNVVLPQILPRAVLRSVATHVTVLDEANDSVLLRVGAGKNWHQLVSECVQAKRYGIENLALIPGSVGAAPVQNIGAYGVELSSVVVGAHGVYLDSGESRYLDKEGCAFAYRDSIFKRELSGRFAITDVDLRLSREPRVDLAYPALAERVAFSTTGPTPHSVFEAVVALRRERLPDPAVEPNAGSFFKNPIVPVAQARALSREYPVLPVFSVDDSYSKVSAAWLIDQCGFKGAVRDRVAVARLHALVLVNRGGVQEDLLALADEIRDAVRARFGCELEIEPVVYRGD
jgi:UDP-N-acetylmuramate dehydrogenase